MQFYRILHLRQDTTAVSPRSASVDTDRGISAIVRDNDILALHIEMALQMCEDFLHTLLKDASFVDLAHRM